MQVGCTGVLEQSSAAATGNPLGSLSGFYAWPSFGLIVLVNCPERERLAGAVSDALRRIIEIALRQHMAVKTSTFEAQAIDQEFAEAVREKERRLGALAEHEREHGCG